MSERWSEMDDLDLMQLEAEMRGDLEELREAATVYAYRTWERSAGAGAMRPAAGRVRRGWMVLATTGVAAAVLTVGGVRLLHRTEVPEAAASVMGTSAAQVQTASPVSDEALLQQIQSDISSGVPAAMEPLQASTYARNEQTVVKR